MSQTKSGDHHGKRGGHLQRQELASWAVCGGGESTITHGTRHSTHHKRLLLKKVPVPVEHGEVVPSTCRPHPARTNFKSYLCTVYMYDTPCCLCVRGVPPLAPSHLVQRSVLQLSVHLPQVAHAGVIGR
ncbi:unnamed protein product, partial [Sphacelaria rigidula]